MKLSRKGIYALRVLPHLAEAYGKAPLSVSQLADLEDVPAKYLEQILSTLRKQGLLVSERGKDGGYALRVPPEEISLGDIVRGVDGPLAPIPCASRTAPHNSLDCPYDFETCWLRQLMLRVRDNISAVLDQENLAEMTVDAGASAGTNGSNRAARRNKGGRGGGAGVTGCGRKTRGIQSGENGSVLRRRGRGRT
ncbi:MAG: Rrf2 family transcriptional regulator [Candidatus Eisenbacteria sp.]|nr:Rrf2 family transcriptional regulator [Candidatus Eisenbacteria bacterium]